MEDKTHQQNSIYNMKVRSNQCEGDACQFIFKPQHRHSVCAHRAEQVYELSVRTQSLNCFTVLTHHSKPCCYGVRPVSMCVCACVRASVHVYVVYEDTNLYNYMSMT